MGLVTVYEGVSKGTLWKKFSPDCGFRMQSGENFFQSWYPLAKKNNLAVNSDKLLRIVNEIHRKLFYLSDVYCIMEITIKRKRDWAGSGEEEFVYQILNRI